MVGKCQGASGGHTERLHTGGQRGMCVHACMCVGVFPIITLLINSEGPTVDGRP